MLITNKYIVKELLKNLILVLFVVVVIFSLFHFLEEMDNNYPFSSKIEYILFSMPYFANLLSMLSILIASIITIGKFSSSKELIILMGGGISLVRFFKIFFIIIFFFSTFLIVSGEFYAPYFYDKAQEIKSLASGQNIPTKNTSNIWLKSQNTYINFGENINGKNFRSVKIYKTNKDNQLSEIYFGDKAYLSNNQLVIQQPSILKISNNIPILVKNKSVQHEGLKINLETSEIKSLGTDVRSMSIYEIYTNIKYLQSFQMKSDEFILEILSRILQPFVLIGLIIITIPLLVDYSRTSSAGKMVSVGISLALIFNLTSKLLQVFTINFGINPYISPLLPLLIIFLLGLVSIKIYSFSK